MSIYPSLIVSSYWAIGVSEMEKEIVKQVSSLDNKVMISEPEPETLSDEKVKVVIREVLDKLYYSKLHK